jgi:hypothetical protein
VVKQTELKSWLLVEDGYATSGDTRCGCLNNSTTDYRMPSEVRLLWHRTQGGPSYWSTILTNVASSAASSNRACWWHVGGRVDDKTGSVLAYRLVSGYSKKSGLITMGMEAGRISELIPLYQICITLYTIRRKSLSAVRKWNVKTDGRMEEITKWGASFLYRNVIRKNTARRVRWRGHVAHRWDTRSA